MASEIFISIESGRTTLTATVGDPDGTRTLTSIVALLIAIGVALVMIAIWMWRTTRPDPEFLAPLEAMGERAWRRGDPVWQRRRLDELRPEGAEPLVPSAAPPEIDDAFEAGPSASGFDDLHHESGDSPVDEPEAVADADPDPTRFGPPTGRPRSWTPPHIDRTLLDGLPDDPVDDDAIAAALADLDAELARGDQSGAD